MPDTKLTKSRLEALLALASGSVAQPLSGLAGLYGLAKGGLNQGADNVERTQQALTYTPRDPRGLQEIANTLAPLTTRVDAGKRYLGDKTFNHTGSPGLATAAYMVPDALMALVGLHGIGIKGPKLAQLVERSAGPTMGSPASQIGAIRAWHGSPHDFDRFSMDKLGTGEGAQAYGHGLYFAGNKNTAITYRGASPHGGVPDATNWTGKLYNVELAPDETDLLDWDAPLHQQPVSVQQAIAQTINSGKLDADALREIQAAHPDALTGKKLYTILQQSDHINNAAGASEHLRNLGIPGIRYLDGGSRAAGDGSRSYVMFDDSLVNIKGKE